MSEGSAEEPRVGWIRGALLVAFAGGLIAGFVLHIGIAETWTLAGYGLVAAGVALLGVGYLLVNYSFPEEVNHVPLPGDIYGDRKAPDPNHVEPADLKGRVPFNASKDVVQRELSPEMAKLYQQLDGLNQQLQRANVKLGLGELSNEGYQKVVAELKKRRATVEHRITQQELVSGDTR